AGHTLDAAGDAARHLVDRDVGAVGAQAEAEGDEVGDLALRLDDTRLHRRGDQRQRTRVHGGGEAFVDGADGTLGAGAVRVHQVLAGGVVLVDDVDGDGAQGLRGHGVTPCRL